jgi:uncharacterized protein YbjT (DUF2867 family)
MVLTGTTSPTLIDLLQEAAHPLTGTADQYDPLIGLIGDARLALLGEASHGTHEFYRERARITQRLIQEKGFTAVAVEADWPDAYRVNCYARGESRDASPEEAEVLTGASVVVDVSNSPSFEDAAVLKFFETSSRNLLAAEAEAGVGHHVALSVVGTERLSESGYFRAKIAQEKLIKRASIPYSIVHTTRFFEFVKSIAAAATDGNKVRLAPVLIQPMAADDVASAVGRVAAGSPLNGTVEVAGPEQFRLEEFIRRGLSAGNDPREVVADPHVRYFGAELSERTLVPGDNARLGETRFEDWLSHPTT